MTTRSTEECERVANELRGYALIVEHDEITRGMLANASELVRDLARERDALLAECEEAWSTNAYNREDLATLKQQHQIEHVELVNLRAAHERLTGAAERVWLSRTVYTANDADESGKNDVCLVNGGALLDLGDALAPGAGERHE